MAPRACLYHSHLRSLFPHRLSPLSTHVGSGITPTSLKTYGLLRQQRTSSSERVDLCRGGQDPFDGSGQGGSIRGRDNGGDVAVGADHPCFTGLRAEDGG